MTNFERALRALQCDIPDKVPIFELLIDHRVIDKAHPGYSYEDFVEEYDIDIALTGTPSSNYRTELIDKEKLIYRDEWGVMRRASGQSVLFPMEGPVKSEKDLENYSPPDPDDPFRFSQLERLINRFKGKRMVGMHVHDAFSYPSYLCGMDNLLINLIEKPALVQELVRIGVEHTKYMIKKARELGADLFVFGDDYGGENGPLMSPKHFERFFLPGMTEVVQTAKSLGASTIKHTDGNIISILSMIVETGIDGIHPLDPEAGMDIGEVKKKFGDRVCVIGNIDTGKILTESTPEIVENTVRKKILDLAPGGGYIIASANSIHPHVQPENYIAMLKATRRFGNYEHLGKEYLL